MVINVEGFIKYSHIFEEFPGDSAPLPKIIDNLRSQTSQEKKAIVVFDAGIDTEENLELIKAKGYHYALSVYRIYEAANFASILGAKESYEKLKVRFEQSNGGGARPVVQNP